MYVHHSLPHDTAPCGCGGTARRVFSPLAAVYSEGPAFKQGFWESLGCEVGSRRELRERLRELEEKMSADEQRDVRLDYDY